MIIEIEVPGADKVRLHWLAEKLGTVVRVRTKYDEKKPTIEEVAIDLADHHGKLTVRKGGK